jgi:putative SOS response-associated peptidase YedK
MCARFTLHVAAAALAERFLLPQVPNLTPRYNIVPSQLIPAMGAKAGGGRGLAMFKSGFVPHWAQDNPKMRPVNAKSETVAASPFFAESFRKRHCLVGRWLPYNPRRVRSVSNSGVPTYESI